MFDDFDDDTDQNEDDAPQEQSSQRNPLRAEIRRLTKANKELQEKVTAGESASRDLAFLRAGVDPADPKAKYFVKGYDGDLTADAIKAEAAAAGLIEAADDGAEQIPADERKAHERMTAATTGAASPDGTDAFTQAIAEARAAGQTQQVIELRQQQAAFQRSQQR